MYRLYMYIYVYIGYGAPFGVSAGSGRSPREGIATHSSILAWRIPWTEDPGRLQSVGLQGSDLALSFFFFFLNIT